ncbi:MAG: hypothetical protein RL125_713, partial [Actinomycetota bacterium]
MKEYDARRRMASQATSDERRKAADLVLDNAGTKEELLRHVERVWQEVLLPRAMGKS